MSEVIVCDGCDKQITSYYWEIEVKVDYQPSDRKQYSQDALERTAHACSRTCLGRVGMDIAEEVANAKVKKEDKQ